MKQNIFNLLRLHIRLFFVIILGILTSTGFSQYSTKENVLYSENFSAIKMKSTELKLYGFTDINYWQHSGDKRGYMISTSPGGWDRRSEVYTPIFKINNRNNLSVEWEIQLPYQTSSYEDKGEDKSQSWKNQNKVMVSLCDSENNHLYTLFFKPNQKSNGVNSFDIKLIKNESFVEEVLEEVRTETITPTSTWLRFKIEFFPMTSKKGSAEIKVSYDAGNGHYVEYLAVEDNSYKFFNKLCFRYKTASSGKNNFHIYVDNIKVSEKINSFKKERNEDMKLDQYLEDNNEGNSDEGDSEREENPYLVSQWDFQPEKSIYYLGRERLINFLLSGDLKEGYKIELNIFNHQTFERVANIVREVNISDFIITWELQDSDLSRITTGVYLFDVSISDDAKNVIFNKRGTFIIIR